jgi:putative intracellular protease/amidase
MTRLNVGVFIYPKVTMLDAYAPHQVFAFVEQFNTFLFAKTKDPLISDSGAILTANHGFDDCPPIDILVVAGAADTLETLRDRETIDFIGKVGRSATYVTSVCTGSLILAEAGLLRGHRPPRTGDGRTAWPAIRRCRSSLIAWSSTAIASPAAASPPGWTSRSP